MATFATQPARAPRLELPSPAWPCPRRLPGEWSPGAGGESQGRGRPRGRRRAASGGLRRVRRGGGAGAAARAGNVRAAGGAPRPPPPARSTAKKGRKQKAEGKSYTSSESDAKFGPSIRPSPRSRWWVSGGWCPGRSPASTTPTGYGILSLSYHYCKSLSEGTLAGARAGARGVALHLQHQQDSALLSLWSHLRGPAGGCQPGSVGPGV